MSYLKSLRRSSFWSILQATTRGHPGCILTKHHPERCQTSPKHLIINYMTVFYRQVQTVLQEHTKQAEVVLLVYRGGKYQILLTDKLPAK